MHNTRLKRLRHRRSKEQLAKRKERIAWRKTTKEILQGVRVDAWRKWL